MTIYLLAFGSFTFLNYIGRIAFPIFAFQVTEGYIHTSNLKKYFLRLLVFALISQIPFMLFLSLYTGYNHLNVFFTLFFGLSAITIYEYYNKVETKYKASHIFYKTCGIFIVFLIAYIAEISKCDYGYFGVLMIFSFYFFKDNKILMNLSFIALVCFFYISRILSFTIYLDLTLKYITIIIFTIVSLIFINLYNHKKGKDIKYFLYLFYPIHLLLLYALHTFIL